MKRSIFIAIAIGILCGYYYFSMVSTWCPQACGEMHRGVVQGTAEAPFRYRILSVMLVDVIVHSGSDNLVAAGYAIGHFIFFPIMFVVAFIWMRIWLSESLALTGILLVAVYVPMMLSYGWGHALYSVLETILICVALLLLYYHPRYWKFAYIALIVIATLNRESAILLPVLMIVISRERLYGIIGIAVWGITYGALRMILGSAPESHSFTEILWINITVGLPSTLIRNALFVPIWILVIRGWKQSDPFLRRLMLPAAVYLVGISTFGVMNEVRLLLPLLAMLIPMGLQSSDRHYSYETRDGIKWERVA